MKNLSNLEIEVKKAIEIEFCKFLSLSRQQVTDAMSAGPCPLGSEKHFEASAKAVLRTIRQKGKSK